jgi:hypothetical protein
MMAKNQIQYPMPMLPTTATMAKTEQNPKPVEKLQKPMSCQMLLTRLMAKTKL